MRLSKIKLIFAKEILDTFRDRRTLLVMVVIPILLYPALMIFVNAIATAQKAKMEQKKVHLALLNVPGDSPLLTSLIADNRLVVVSTENPMDDVRAGRIDYVLEMPAGAENILENNQSLSVKLHVDQSNDDAVVNIDRIHKIIDAYNQKLLQERLNNLNINEEYVHPIRVSEVNVASQQKMGGFLIGRFLPMLMPS